MLTMTCIAVERFQGILYPLHVCNNYFLCHAFKMLGELWRERNERFLVVSGY